MTSKSLPPIPEGKRRIYNVARYPCPHGCSGSMYFCMPDGKAMRCPYCGLYSERVEPIRHEYLDIDIQEPKSQARFLPSQYNQDPD